MIKRKRMSKAKDNAVMKSTYVRTKKINRSTGSQQGGTRF